MNEDEKAPKPSNLPAKATWSAAEWTWSHSDQEKWRHASPEWQNFMEYWMDPSRASELHRNEFPYALTIFPSSPPFFSGYETFGTASLAHTRDCTILVFERYAFLYNGIDRWQRLDIHGGAIVAGQSGIGKSLFLWYLLVRLIHDKQPVVLHLPQKEGMPSILFYDGCAWSPKDKDNKSYYLPHAFKKSSDERCTIVLVDSPDECRIPHGLTQTHGWPIYATSPERERCHQFLKHRNVTLWGLDLWSREDLRKGLELQDQWQTLQLLLTQYLASPKTMQIKVPNRLRKAIKTVKDPKYDSWPKATVRDLVDILLDDAIYQHGLEPRWVFRRVLASVRPVSIPSNILLQRIQKFFADMKFPAYGLSTWDVVSDEILALRMQPHSLNRLDSTEFYFVIKSAAVWEQLQESLSTAAGTQVRQVFESLRAFPSGSVLAGRIFAEFALNQMKENNPPRPLKRMMHEPSSTLRQPLFIQSDLEEMREDEEMEMENAEAQDQFMTTRGRTLLDWHEQNYEDGQPNSLLAWGPVIFTPQAVATDHPKSFDAFFLDVPDDNNPLFRVLWILQFTTRPSWNHGGSDSKGFRDVQRLMEQAGHGRQIDGLGSGSTNEVEVRWVLVTPTTATRKEEREWQMPLGWESSVSDGQDDHRGSVWLQEMDFE